MIKEIKEDVNNDFLLIDDYPYHITEVKEETTNMVTHFNHS